MRIKLLAFVSVFLILNTGCPGPCGDGGNGYFDVIEIETNLRDFSNAVISEDAALVGVDAENIFLQAYVVFNTFSATAPTNPFVSMAYACSPLPPRPIQVIKNIQIHSDADLNTTNATYPAGTALAEIFDLEYEHFTGSLTTFNAEGNNPSSLNYLLLSLNTAIVGDQMQQFTLTYTQLEEDGGLEETFVKQFYRVRLLE